MVGKKLNRNLGGVYIMPLSDNDKFQLQKMIDAHDVTDHTENIRDVKHSAQIRKSIQSLITLKSEHADLLRDDKDEFERIALMQDGSLFYNYFQIYNKILKDQIDLTMLDNLLDVLKQIETGVYDQHEGSFVVGKLLKELYIDSTIRETAELDAAAESQKPVIREGKKISWKEYKVINE
jgi:hypothetical protein